MYNDVCTAECGLQLLNKVDIYLLTYLLKLTEKFYTVHNTECHTKHQ